MHTRAHHYKNIAGMTLVELLIAIAVLMLVFGGLMGSFRFVTALVGSSKAHAGAVALANGKMEYIRSLAYDDVGTISGIPNGPIPQQSTTTLNGITYSERVLIQFIDAPQDGMDVDDENGIVADYKLVKVEYSWLFRGDTKTVSLITNVVPRGIETTAGGGTLTVNVFDAQVQPVSGAAVRVYNDTGGATIDTTRYTNMNGVAMFSGAPASAGYEITVTKDGFSTDQTYEPSVSNPLPTTLPVAVLEANVSTMNFQIDALSDLAVRTVGLPTLGVFEDLLDDATGIASQNNTAVAAGAVVLAGAPGAYSTTGIVYSNPVTPGIFEAWNTAHFDADIPQDTSIVLRVYNSSGGIPPALIPDTDLPGNSSGFGPGAINLSSLDVSTYQALSLGATLATSDLSTTSALLDWSMDYVVSQPAISNIPFTLTSGKMIGIDGLGFPVYKHQNSFATDASGDVSIEDMEFDVYEVRIDDPAYAVAEACENIPYALDPGTNDTLVLTLAPATAHSLRVRIQDIHGNAIAGATIVLSQGSFTASHEATACGQAFFGGLATAADYALDIEATGYGDQTMTDIEISGKDSLVVTLIDA